MIDIYINNVLKVGFGNNILYWEITDNEGANLDKLVVTIDNSKLSYELPNLENKDFKIEIVVNNIKMGSFFVVSTIYNGKTIDITAVSQHPKYSSIKNKIVFKEKKLKDVLLSLCTKLKLSLNFDVTLETETIDYYLQNNTDLFVINELAEIYGAIANIKYNSLSFFSKNKLQKTFNYDEQEIISLVSIQNNYKIYNGCKFDMWDFKQANNEEFSIGDAPYLEVQPLYSLFLSKKLTYSKFLKLKEKINIKITLLYNPDLQSGFYINIINVNKYKEFAGLYRIQKVIHCNTKQSELTLVRV